MRNFLWQVLAWLVSRPRIADWLIQRSKRTPYSPILSRDEREVYMGRWWLFNAYSKDEAGNAGPARWSWLPSVRVHHILRADDDEHLHDHPWNARTIVLRHWYYEERPYGHVQDAIDDGAFAVTRRHYDEVRGKHARRTGYTGRVLFNSYHRICTLPAEGVYTLWFTWKYRDTWGFLVEGRKVPWREYLKTRPRA